MTGLKIIEAFGGIDDDLILDAENRKRAIPLWLKYASLAACLLCAVTLFGLSLGRIFAEPEAPGEAFAEPSPSPIVSEVPAEDSAEETAPVSPPVPEPTGNLDSWTVEPMEDRLYWQSTGFVSTTLHAPGIYEGEIFPDFTFTHDDSYTNISSIFTFIDNMARTNERDYTGLVWCICATDLNGWSYDPSIYGLDDSPFYIFNDLILGFDESHVYTLVYPDPAYQVDPSDAAALSSYHQHLTDGLNIINDFIETNSLTEYYGWRNRYRSRTLVAVENSQKKLNGEAVYPEDEDWGIRSLKLAGLALNLPADMQDSIVTDVDSFSFSLYEPISNERLGEGGGWVWQITAYTTEEFCNIYGRENTDFTGDSLDASSYMLAKRDGYVYMLYLPTDVRYDPASDESRMAYARYRDLSPRILESFISLNSDEMIDAFMEQNPYLDLAALFS